MFHSATLPELCYNLTDIFSLSAAADMSFSLPLLLQSFTELHLFSQHPSFVW